MSKRTSFGTWLEQALRSRGMKPAGLAHATGRTRSAISQLMSGESPSQELRANIARALKIPLEEIPPHPFGGTANEVTGYFAGSYFAPGEEPARTTLRLIDNGVPDHQVPRLAADLGYFWPFNIIVEPDVLPESDYPTAQYRAFELLLSPSNPITLVPGPWTIYTRGRRTFVSRVNRYTGYALIAKTETALASVSAAPNPEAKLDAFMEMMKRIVDRRAERCVAFVDKPARDFYEILFDLYSDLESEQVKPDIPSSTDHPKRNILDALDDIGDKRADFVVGHAKAVALAAGSHEGRHPYKLLVGYSDLEDVILAAKGSRIIMGRILRNQKFAVGDAATSTEEAAARSRRPRAVKSDDQESVLERSHEKFTKAYRRRLESVALDNVWALNIELSDVVRTPNLEALACRIAGVAYRIAERLHGTDERQEDALKELFGYTREGVDSERFENMTPDDFKWAWNRSFQITPFDDQSLKWVQQFLHDHMDKPEMRANGESLETVTKLMLDKKSQCEERLRELKEYSLDEIAKEHRLRAEHHHSVFSYWDAADYADKALRHAKETLSVGEGTRAGRYSR